MVQRSNKRYYHMNKDIINYRTRGAGIIIGGQTNGKYALIQQGKYKNDFGGVVDENDENIISTAIREFIEETKDLIDTNIVSETINHLKTINEQYLDNIILKLSKTNYNYIYDNYSPRITIYAQNSQSTETMDCKGIIKNVVYIYFIFVIYISTEMFLKITDGKESIIDDKNARLIIYPYNNENNIQSRARPLLKILAKKNV